jgi:signal transduction histidine kinase
MSPAPTTSTSDPKRQFPWRSALVGVWVLALVAVAVVFGTYRLEALLERRTDEVFDGIESSQRALVALAPELAAGPCELVPFEGCHSVVLAPAESAAFGARSPEAWSALERGATRVLAGSEWWVSRSSGSRRLVTVVPVDALDRRLAPERNELTLVLWGSATALLVAALTVAIVVRRRLWDFRARETAQYVIAIRREGAKWKALTESAADMIFIVDPRDGTTLERNRMAVATLGDASLRESLPAEHFAELERGLERARSEPGAPVALPELSLRANDGRELRVDARLAGIDLGDARVVEISMRDVTRERAMERQLSITERLSSLGLLTAGVAHEINNPLEGIGNYLTLLEKPDAPPEKRARYVEQVRVGFDRIRDIVRDLLSFARPGVERGEADLRQVVERTRKLVSYTKPFESVQLDVRGLEQPLVVPGDRGRLEQVLLNVLLNAATAMGGKGRVAVEARKVERGFAGEPTVRITIDDEGPGIPPENLSRLFDPFFTTTQGSGLGLSISYGIVQAHGGALTASNRSGGGARFVIELPATRAGSTSASAI